MLSYHPDPWTYGLRLHFLLIELRHSLHQLNVVRAAIFFILTLSTSTEQFCKLGPIVPILQMGKSRLREIRLITKV